MTMATHYERLSAQDRSFLVFDSPTTPMHVSAVLILDDALPRTAEGAIDIGLIRRYVSGQLHVLPRYRQRLLFTPLLRYPAWGDDARFDIRYHVRHTSLPRPGTIEQLRDLTGRLMSQPMDQGRPLWELWIVEGLANNRVGLVIKVHHCVMDGSSGVELLMALMSASPDQREICREDWIPRPTPSTAELLRDDLRLQTSLPVTKLRALQQALRDSADVPAQLADLWSGLRETMRVALRPADDTPLNQLVGSARRVCWTRVDLDPIKSVKNQLGGTVNDVVIAAVSGALRQLFKRRRTPIDKMHVRATVPVNIRADGEQTASGNRVSAWLVDLPIRERDPLRRYAKVTAMTTKMKQSAQAQLIEKLTDAADGFHTVLTLGVRLAAYLSPYTLIITNVVGPSFPLYFLGSRLLEAYPFAPLFRKQGLAVGVISYAGSLFIGCNADWDTMPDVDAFADAVRRAFAELEKAAARPVPQRSSARSRAAHIKLAARA